MGFGFVSLKDGIAELKTVGFYRDLVCEFHLEVLLLFTGQLTRIPMSDGSPPTIERTAVTAGLMVFVLIEAFGHLQWSPMNPVVNLCLVCTNRYSVIKGMGLLLADLAGSYTGTALAGYVVPGNLSSYLGAIQPHPEVSDSGALVCEMLETCILMVVVIGSLDEDFRQVYMPGFPIGLSITLIIMAAGPISGGIVNPIVAFGPAAYSGNFHRHWIYWVGDYCGGGLALIGYYFYSRRQGIFSPPGAKDEGMALKMPHQDRKGSQVPIIIRENSFSGSLPMETVVTTNNNHLNPDSFHDINSVTRA